MTKARTGRPATYDDAQVLAAVASIEATGAAPTTDGVKRILVAEHGISTGINAQSLGDRVATLIEVRDDERRSALLLTLPVEARQAAKGLAADLERRLLDHMALSYDGLRSAAAEEVVAREADLRTARQRIAALEAETAVAAEDAATAEAEINRLRDALAKAAATDKTLRATLATRDAELAASAHERIGRDATMALVLEALGGRTTAGNVAAMPGQAASAEAAGTEVGSDDGNDVASKVRPIRS